MTQNFEDEEGEVATRSRADVTEPPMFKVLLLNDNYTTMEFVVFILEKVFRKPAEQAQQIMLAVHRDGAGVAGVYTKEIAETKAAVAQNLARQNQFPLKCVIEADHPLTKGSTNE